MNEEGFSGSSINWELFQYHNTSFVYCWQSFIVIIIILLQAPVDTAPVKVLGIKGK